MAHCQACGNALPEGAQFCASCGAHTTPAPVQPAAQGPQQTSSGGCGKILAIIFVIVLLIIAAIGGVAYWGYMKAKQKVEQVKSEVLNTGTNGGTAKNSSGLRVAQRRPLPCGRPRLSRFRTRHDSDGPRTDIGQNMDDQQR